MEETREELLKKLGRYFISSETDYHSSIQHLNRALKDIDERLNDLEFSNNQNGKMPDVSRGKKMSLLMELGVIDYLFQKDIPQHKLAELLSLIINATPVNIVKDLSERHNANSSIKKKVNYKFLVETFSSLKLDKYEEKCQKVLNSLED
jgi:hypothetical protein